MSKVITVSQDEFKQGLVALPDDSKAPFGSARKMLNCQITDRGGIAPRDGTLLLGATQSGGRSNGFYNFKKTLETEQYPLNAFDGNLKFYHPTEGWQLLKAGFTDDEDFGFTYSLVNGENDDFVYFCNRFEEYQRWSGAVTQLNGALAGAEGTLTVDSTLKTQIYEALTAASSTTTTITVAGTPWTADMWINFYVLIKDGASAGKIAKITDNTDNDLTFDTIAGVTGTVSFEIRQLAFPVTGTLIYNGTNIAYTAIPSETQFTVSSAHAAPDNTPVTVVPEVYSGNPRGNRLESLLGRVVVGNVRSAMSRDSGGNLQGSASAGSVFVSKILNPTDFTFQATRVAGEGDIINMPYGGGPITDVKAQEEYAYLYKKNYIEAFKYSADTDDIAVRIPLKTGIGSVGKVIKGRDDHFFMTLDHQYTSLGRVASKDIEPQSQNIGIDIKRLLESYVHDDFNGAHFNNRVLSCHKSSSDNDNNDVMLVRNLETKSFEGVWTLSARFLDTYNDKLHFAESNGPNVWEMFQDFKYDKIDDDNKLPITADWRSNFFNLLPIKAHIQGINSVALEGYINADTIFTFSLYADFSDSPILEFDFGGTEETFLSGDNLESFLGANPLGLHPIGTVDAPGSDGRRRFSFQVYFPWLYGQYFSTGVKSSGVGQDWEMIRIGLGLKESVSTKGLNIKAITE